jgi:hypothetical protein
MLRLKNLSNKYQKRTCRPVYAQTQATPYAASLHSSLRDSTTGSIVQLTYSIDANRTNTDAGKAYQSNNSYLPGMVVTRIGNSEDVTIAYGNSTERPFGLLANFVGGDFDEGFNGDRLQNEVGVWRGPDSVFEILSPAYGTITPLATDVTGNSNSGKGTPLYAGTDGRLTSATGQGNTIIAYLVKKEANRILVDLAI